VLPLKMCMSPFILARRPVIHWVLTNKLTSRSRVFFEKLVDQLVNKFFALYGIRKFVVIFTKEPAIGPCLGPLDYNP